MKHISSWSVLTILMSWRDRWGELVSAGSG